ncbi:MAG: ribonuclease R [Gammaproteobacteria bacterium SG8_11]|nr:MAG: ribonuclease R [Gammaproteobacteria bacterium SG8_11]
MKSKFRRSKYVIQHPFWFLKKTIAGFRANQGVLLAGAVAYNTLLSLLPMLALILIVLSQLTDVQQLLETTREYLGLVAPGHADELIRQIEAFVLNWKLVGAVGLVVLVFFSSLAFTMLENAMSVIFFHRVAIRRRHFMISAIIPYAYMFFLALGLLLVSGVSGVLHSLDDETLVIVGREWSLGSTVAFLLYILGVLGEVMMLTSLYLVMPIGQLSLRHALLGGITATMLWEISRHLLVWYFTTLSLVNVVYGAFATAIVILLSLEVAALILLFGAQVISEYERIDTPPEANGELHT